MKRETENAPAADELSDDQAAEFAALQAGAVDAAPGAPAAPDAFAPPSAGSMAAAGMIVGTARPILCFLVKGLRGAPAEVWEPLPQGVAGLLDHYGIGESEILQSPWGRMALCSLPLVGYVLTLQEQETEKQPAPGAAPAVVGAPAVADPAAPKVLERG